MNLPKVGDLAIGTVVKVYPNFAILLFEDGWTGLLHISELSNNFIRSFTSFVKIGSIYHVKVIAVDEESESVKVSLKQVTQAERRDSFRHQDIDPATIDFSALEAKIPEWAKKQIEEQ
ncbi:MAG: S1 RNA-binding domain-containing protein [Bacilli bacterium]|nr:S1 RNA-binding domain-containing protein [Bacilli bacterium]MBQ4255893.1 S1 RNA-binding domain-containing protein [Bacilli bacterium]